MLWAAGRRSTNLWWSWPRRTRLESLRAIIQKLSNVHTRGTLDWEVHCVQDRMYTRRGPSHSFLHLWLPLINQISENWVGGSFPVTDRNEPRLRALWSSALTTRLRGICHRHSRRARTGRFTLRKREERVVGDSLSLEGRETRRDLRGEEKMMKYWFAMCWQLRLHHYRTAKKCGHVQRKNGVLEIRTYDSLGYRCLPISWTNTYILKNSLPQTKIPEEKNKEGKKLNKRSVCRREDASSSQIKKLTPCCLPIKHWDWTVCDLCLQESDKQNSLTPEPLVPVIVVKVRQHDVPPMGEWDSHNHIRS